MIGKTISHYKILEKLGAGGMGVVYKAQDTKLDRFVALKFLPPHLSTSEEEKKRFIHEAKAASALDHNNICTIYEIDETEDGQMFIAMACYEGESLKKKIERGPLPIAEAIDIAMQVAEGLTKAHSKDIVHRDLKPANVMVTNDGVVKIVDFGLAKLAGRTKLTKEGTTLGTVAYMSPEQTQGAVVDHRTDVWSLGVVLYEMVTGQSPFHGDYGQAVMYSILNEDPEPITALRTGVPMELETVVSKALAKSPNERYQHADEILTDLLRMQKTMSTKPLQQASPAAVSWPKKWLASPVFWTLFIVLFGLAAGVLLFYPSKTVSFSERDWILITDFENLTGEEVFDRSLNTALTVSIEQSSYINVFARRRIRATLKRMKKEGKEQINDVTGREIAVREGINVLLVPSISRVGKTYALTGVLQDAISGRSLLSEIVQAQDKDDVLRALDVLAERIRRNLGESMTAISKKSKPLAKTTTSSLEALKQYSLAIENHRQANFDEARLYYQNALRIDSTFTAARASLGMINFENFDREEGKEMISDAIQDLEDLTDKEKYGILAFHARTVENDLEKAVGYLKTLIALYPDHGTAHNNLGWFYQQMGRYEEAVVEYKEAIRIDPYFMLTYDGLSAIYLYHLGELDSALVWCRRQISKDPNHVWAYDRLGWACLGKDSLAQAQKAFEKALEINPRITFDLYRLAHTYRLQGRLQDALRPLERILKVDSSDAWAHYQLGVVYQLMGKSEMAQRLFERFRQNAEKWVRDQPQNGYNYIALGLALTRSGKVERGWYMGQKAMALDSTEHFGFAQLLSVLGRRQDALDQLGLAVQNGYTNYIWIKIHPDFQALYDAPRFKELMRRVLKN